MTMTEARFVTSSGAERSRWRRALVAAVLALLAAELATRIAAPWLREPEVWSNPEANAKWHQMSELEHHGGADTVFVGSSLVGVGVDPAQYGSTRASARPDYNAALLSSSIGEQTVWLQEFVVPFLHPKAVVIGVSWRELNANDPSLDQADAIFPTIPEVRHALGRESTIEKAERLARSASYLFRYREVLRDPVNMFEQGALTPESAMTAQGMTTTALDHQFSDADQAILTRAKDVVGRYALGEGRLSQLASLLQWLHGQGITPVVLNMPMTPVGIGYLPHGQVDYDTYSQRLRDLAGSLGIQCVETGIWPVEQFADPFHVNRQGAHRLTELLAKEVR
jgi:hypothetical protein